MKNISTFIVMMLCAYASFSQEIITGSRANSYAPGSELIRTSRISTIPDYIRFHSGSEIALQNVIPYLQQHFNMNSSMNFQLLNTETDRLGYTHYRYQQTCNGVLLQGSMYIVHTKNDKVISMNGMIFPSLTASTSTSISENAALQKALDYVHADVYRWQIRGQENLLKMMRKNAEATYYPQGILQYAPEAGNYSSSNYKLTYAFDVYAERPLSRQVIYVDAQTGNVIFTLNRINDNNPVNGTAITAYSGSKTIVVDSEAVNKFYLRDTTRAGGVVTLNMNHSTFDYAGADNFLDTDNNWNNVNANQDQYATDSHFGMEKTFDFYDSAYNRNSIDNNGMAMYGYVHYDNNYYNAFWDGQSMNFGDGDPFSGVTPLTTLDITGHEMTHGVTQFSCNLNYFGESGGLNESFSDCAGEMVERLGQGTNDWLIGAEIGETIRWMYDPQLDGLSASSYGDDNWNNFTDVHWWSGPQNHWFYILSAGDTGVNSLGVSYTVAGIGIDEAHAITYRNQTVYLVPSSDYADARFYAIQAASDLFGACTPEVISCVNAWHAVGVGDTFVAEVNADFAASSTSLCSLGNPVHFTNLTENGQTYFWDFGDGSTSTDISPDHLYSEEGTYSVSLAAEGGACGTDTLDQIDYITLDLPEQPVAFDTITCKNSPAVLTALGSGYVAWYDSLTGGSLLGTGSPFVTQPVNTTTTFYAENDVVPPVESVGPPNNNFGTGSYFTFTNPHYVIFDAYDDLTIQTVTVYSNQSGSRTIELLDNTGNLVTSTTQNIPNGTQVITLNFQVSAGTDYMLGLQDGSLSQLYRNSTGAQYPSYTIPGLISLTGNEIPDQDHYYYFYNWQVQKSPCRSIRVPATVTLLPKPNSSFDFSVDNYDVTFTNTSSGDATSYLWIFGDGSTSDESDPVHEYSAGGNYTVKLLACIGSCCDTFTQTINIISTGINTTDLNSSFMISPNPFNNYLQLTYSGSTLGAVKVQLMNVLGEVMMSEERTSIQNGDLIKLNSESLSSGIYFIRLEGHSLLQTFKVTKQE